MKKLIVLSVLFLTGCAGNTIPTISVTYSKQENGQQTLEIKHSNYAGGNSSTVVLRDAKGAEEYRRKLEKLIREIDEFERELTISEKK